MLFRLSSNACSTAITFLVFFAASGFAAQCQTPQTSGQDASGKSRDVTVPAKPDEASKPAADKPVTDKQNKETEAVLQRQKQLADDTAKLLVLANELKAEMDKSTKDTLSLGVVKKAEAVEKLAHKVRDEMKKSMGN